MVSLQLSIVSKCLKEELPRLDFQASRVTMILLDRSQMIPFFRQFKDKDNFLQAEVYGYSIYHYSDFDLRLRWKVASLKYHGVYGVNFRNEDAQIVDVELLHKNRVVRLHNQNEVIDESSSLALLKKPFETFLQDWKLYPFLSADNMQPTHYKVKKELFPGLVVDEIVEIDYKTYPQLRKRVADNGGYELLGSFSEAVSVEGHFVCMEGFSSYRLGKEEDGCLAHLHWLVRRSLDADGQVEIAIVESDNLPGAFFTGVNMLDSFDEGRDILAIMRLLKFEQSWRKEAIELLKDWFRDKKPHNQKLLETMDLPFIDNDNHDENSTRQTSSKGNPRSYAHKDKSHKSTKAQLDLFGKDWSAYEYEKHTVLNGNKQLNFSGLHIGRVVDKENSNGEINIFDLYQTDRDQWVGVKRQVSYANNSSDVSKAEYLRDKNQLFQFFQNDGVVDELFKQAQTNNGQQK